MAQTNFTPISLYFSTTAAAVPTAGNLVNGELAINITDGKLYYKDNAGVVKVIAGAGGTGIVAGSNTQVQYNNNGVFGASANLTFNGTTLTTAGLSDSGNLTFTGTGNRITGDFNNAAQASRVLFQTSSTNASTNLGLIPNGTNVNSNLITYNNSDTTNASRMRIGIDGTAGLLVSDFNGTGTALPMAFYTGGAERLRIDTSGNSLLGTTTGFTTTEIAGSSVVSGAGIYPFVLSSTASQNTTITGSLIVQNATSLARNGTSTTTSAGIIGAPRISNNGSGTSTQTVYGVYGGPVIDSTSNTANINLYGGGFFANRTSSNDIGTNNAFLGGLLVGGSQSQSISTTIGNIYGVFSTASLITGVATSVLVYNGNLTIGGSTATVPSSTANGFGIRLNSLSVGTTAGGQTASVTNLYAYMVNAINIRDTATVTNYYGLFLNSATVTGVLTNNWGVYQNDTAANNYFAGNVGLGTTTVRAQEHIFGVGQLTAALTDAGARGGMLRVSDNSSSAGAGGAILFASSQGDVANSVGFAAIKGLLGNGSDNTAGDLAFSTRNAAADTALTERMRITAAGDVGIGTSSPSGRLDVVTGANFNSRFFNNAGGNTDIYVNTSAVARDWIISRRSNGEGWLYMQGADPIVLYTNGAERMRFTSTGNALLGTTVDYTTTTNAGNMAVAGLGIYPYTIQTGTTNTTVSSSLNIENLTIFSGNNGTSSQTYDGIISTPKGSNTGAGGTNFVTVRGGTFQPSIQSSGSAARVQIVGVTATATRNNANDTSTASNNSVFGVSAVAQNGTSAAAGIVTGTAAAVQGNVLNNNGTITTMYGFRGLNQIANSTAALSASSTNSYVYSSEASVGSSSGGPGTVTNLFGYRSTLTVGATGTVSNYYGLFLGIPIVTGTLTNRWGVYQEDPSSPNFFNGNVGIGTTSPTTRLVINGGPGTAQTRFEVSTTEVQEVATNAAQSAYANRLADAAQHIWKTSSAEAMRINSSGTLLVACTTGPSSTNRGVSIATNGPSGMQIAIANTITAGFAGNVVFINGNGQVGSIDTSGTSTSYVTTSDYRLKENIAPMTGALDVVSALKPVTYKWKTDGSNSQGFIAHELQAVVPECVSGEKDAVDDEGKPKYQGIDTSFLVATLTAAIQEQQALIEQLTTRLNALEGK
jgi:hypothetical protein